MKCVNCGRHETDQTVCDVCRKSFPGDPAALEEMIAMFKLAQAMGITRPPMAEK